ncbi:Fructosamine/Ketosamine-3-kinase [Xylariales sp. PMI_506]|nr:Fructosamine/Ketosamine-3-kinase [Xylariales sp. PMI_506]
MLQGEFTAISLIHSLDPGMAPKPLGWGEYKAGFPETYFFIEDFHDMNLDLPDPAQLAKRLVQLHQHKSPNGMFGFPVTTFNGKVDHVTQWEPSWSKFFGRLLRNTLRHDEEINGHWPELSKVAEQVLTHVVPRLLEVLQSGPDPIVPRLIHADLWQGNLGTDEETGEIIFYDAGSYFAHNEMELGMWRRHAIQYLGPRYLREYQLLFSPSEPTAEFDDRNRLYCLHYLINFSVGHPGAPEREYALNNMAYLCEKYAPLEGLVSYDAQKDPSARRRDSSSV